MKPLDLFTLPLQGSQLIEASAGTGKTWTITALYARLLLEGIPIESLLVVTFTKAATAELRDRLRDRLTELLTVFEYHDPLTTEALDPLHQGFLTKYQDDLATAKQRLALALTLFDEAAIYTIHSFCQRVLTESAFEAGSDFDQELLSSTDEMLKQVAADFWRGYLHEADPIWVDYLIRKKESPDTWAKRVKPHLGKPYLHQPHLSEDGLDKPLEQLSHCRSQLAKTLQDEGEAALDALLSHPKLNGRTHHKSCIPDWFNELRTMATSDGLPPVSKGLEKLTTSAIVKAMNKGGVPPAFSLFDAVEAFSIVLQALHLALEARWVALNHRLVTELGTRLTACHQEARTLAFDDLLTSLQSALQDARGPALIDAVRTRYRAALIDEFQDTDPIQWEIFSQLFLKTTQRPPSCVILVGDPKQAIYSFRGGDLHTYLTARQQVQACYSLHRNFRSVPALVSGIHLLFESQPRPFIQDIEYLPVEGVGSLHLKIEGETHSAPIRLKLLLTQEGSTHHTKTSASQYATAFSTAEIAHLLNEGEVGKAFLIDEKTGQSRVLTPGDIAVLVPGHREAQQIEAALAALNVPAVRRNRESVFASIEAQDMHTVLYAVAHPKNEGALHAALASIAMGYSGADLAELKDQPTSNMTLLSRFQHWHDRWQKHSFIAMFRDWLDHIGPDGFNVAARLLALEGGERRLTNLLHLAELIQLQSQNLPSITRLLHWYEQQLTEPDHNNDTMLQRLPSDAQRVNIVTIHASKGLEYPVVFCPYLWDGKLLHSSDIAARCHDPDGRVWLDFGSSDYLARRQQQRIEALAEKRRLLYVALTRAQSRLYLYWGLVNPPKSDQDEKGLHTAALAGLLHGQGTAYLTHCTQADLEADLAALCQRAPTCFALDILEAPPQGDLSTTGYRGIDQGVRRAKIFVPMKVHGYFSETQKGFSETQEGFSETKGFEHRTTQNSPSKGSGTEGSKAQHDHGQASPALYLEAALFSRVLQPSWSLTSFTHLTRQQSKRSIMTASEIENLSEQPDHDTDVATPVPASADLHELTFPAGEVAAHVAGICLHAIFEDWANEQPLTRSVPFQLARHGIHERWQPIVTRMVETTLAAPLHIPIGFQGTGKASALTSSGAPPCMKIGDIGEQRSQADHAVQNRALKGDGYIPSPDSAAPLHKQHKILRLKSLPRAARRAEIEFTFSTHHIDLTPLAEILADHHQPAAFIEAARQLTIQDSGLVSSFVRGFIDLIFCFDTRYFLVDWKSNWLGSNLSCYTPEKLETAMAAHHYDLQALIYTLALDRYLSVRIADYDYDRHVGGAYYLFLRGIQTGSAKTGVWFKRFESALLKDIAKRCGIS